MIVKANYKKFQSLMNSHYPEAPVNESEAAEAFHNLVEYIRVLMQINERVRLVKNNKPKK